MCCSVIEMSQSIRDQLLGLGFKQAPKPAKPRPKKSHAKPPKSSRNGDDFDLAKAYAVRAKQEKAEKKAALEAQKRKAEEKRRAKQAVATLLADKAQNIPDAAVPRHFEHLGKIRRVYVTQEQLSAINEGALSVVMHQGSYLIVSTDVAKQVATHIPRLLALMVDPNAEDAGSEPSTDGVPDDLMW